MDIRDQHGNPIAIGDLPVDVVDEITVNESFWRRGRDAGVVDTLKAIMAGQIPGFTYGPVKAAQPVAFEVAGQPITINLPPPSVVVNQPAEMKIVGMPDRLTHRVIQRDRNGQISELADIETDGPAA